MPMQEQEERGHKRGRREQGLAGVIVVGVCEITRLRFASLRMTCGWRRCVMTLGWRRCVREETGRGGKMGSRPPPSRGQDFDARTRGGGLSLRQGQERLQPSPIEGEGVCRREKGYFHVNDIWLEGGWVPAFARTREAPQPFDKVRRGSSLPP